MRAEKLVAALLALGRSESGYLDRDELQLDELIGDTVAEVVPSIPSHELRVDLELHSVRVAADRALLDCMTRNVLDNAVKHNRPEGWIDIRVGVDERPDGRRALFEVRNSTTEGSETRAGGSVDGEGWPSESHGIGLTVVEAIAEAHGGAVECRRAEPDVFVVRVLLPVVGNVESVDAPSTSSLVMTDHVSAEHH
jgi:signal transduction histidine kinase